MAVSADGKVIASGDGHRYTYVFDAESKEPMGKPLAFQVASVQGLSLTDDGSIVSIVALD